MTDIRELNADGPVEIFNPCGVRIYQGNISEANLEKGVYIIRTGNRVKKVILK